MKRPVVDDDDDFVEPKDGGLYFAPTSSIDFVSSGCALLDCVMGGGYALGRIANIVGDKSSGKTLLAIEACANLFHQYEKGRVYYFESEAAFDKEYAESLGIPVKKIRFIAGDTVEEFFKEVDKVLAYETKVPSLFILDSLDALSDKAEMERQIDEGSYAMAKAKKMSELFRRQVRKLRDKNVGVIIISQVRDDINASWGRKVKRTGGRALDFYASQVMYLAQMEVMKKTINKITRPIGVKVKCKVDKNKIGMPLRECEFSIRFGYGVDDIRSNLEWLDQVDALDSFETGGVNKVIKRFEVLKPNEQRAYRKKLADFVGREWRRVEKEFAPTRKKYSN